MTDRNAAQGDVAGLAANGWQVGTAEPNGRTITGITSAAVIYGVPVGATVRAYPTSAGTATAYSTTSPARLARLDILAGAASITGSANARWAAWTPGAVIADTAVPAGSNMAAIALVVASGTLTLEVC